jgi:ribosomal protein S18 acetylase RimI-like enzyme
MPKLPTLQTAKAAPRDFAIRPASLEDSPAILQCLRSAFEPYRAQYTPQAYLDTVMTPDTLAERLRKMIVLVAMDTRENVVGTIGGATVSVGEGHLRGMAVPPQHHGHGIAQLLLESMEKHLKTKCCVRITLDTTEPLQRAMRFYEKNRYCRTGKITDFFGMPLIEYAKDL